MKYFIGMMTLCLMVAASSDHAQAVDQDADKAAIEKSVASYTAAFNKRDAKSLAAHWSPDAVYVNPLSGNQVEGREAITAEFTAILGQLKDHKLAVDVESIDFVSPNVAVETGSAKLMSADGKAEESTYTAIHVKRDGKWLLDRVTEKEVPVILSHHDNLKELEWLIGKWIDADNTGSVETTCAWTRNKNFMTRSFTVSLDGQVDLAGMQIIGWDPAEKQIRSWLFDSDGGFAEGRWTKNGNRWSIVTAGTLPDGGKTSSVNVITMLDNDSFQWKSINRVADGELLPNIDEVVVVRAE